MYRFAFRPSWLLSHVFAASLVALFVTLGFWQLSRHDEKVDRNQTVSERTEEPVVPVQDMLGPLIGPVDDTADDTVDDTAIEDLRYREATVRGTYETGSDVLIDNRSFDGLPGAWVVTPLRLDDGSVIAVSRGFQGFDSGIIDPPPPPAGTVEVVGTVLPWDQRSCGIRAHDDGTPAGAACLSEDAVEAAVGEPVLPVALQRTSSTPAEAEVLVPVPLPELDEGPHRSYAVQWFIFATIGLVGYPLILRRVARDRAAGSVPDAAPSPAGDDLDQELAALLADGGSDQARS